MLKYWGIETDEDGDAANVGMWIKHLVQDGSFLCLNTNIGLEQVMLRLLLTIERKTGALGLHVIVIVIYDYFLPIWVKWEFDMHYFIRQVSENTLVLDVVGLKWVLYKHKVHGGQWYIIAARQDLTEHEPCLIKCFYFSTLRF